MTFPITATILSTFRLRYIWLVVFASVVCYNSRLVCRNICIMFADGKIFSRVLCYSPNSIHFLSLCIILNNQIRFNTSQVRIRLTLVRPIPIYKYIMIQSRYKIYIITYQIQYSYLGRYHIIKKKKHKTTIMLYCYLFLKYETLLYYFCAF